VFAMLARIVEAPFFFCLIKKIMSKFTILMYVFLLLKKQSFLPFELVFYEKIDE
jgi:hypothetical protein